MLGDELTDSYLTVASYGGVGQASTPVHHGHDGKKDDLEIDAERFSEASTVQCWSTIPGRRVCR